MFCGKITCNICTSNSSKQITTKTNYRKPFKTGIMKTTVKQFATVTFIALLLLAGNVKAEGTEIKASGLEIIETTLQLENWMTDEIIWETNTFYAGDLALEKETDIELESWMTNDSMWNSDMHFDTETETEVELELEDWMTSEENWNVQEADIEKELALENWMVDSKIWKL